MHVLQPKHTKLKAEEVDKLLLDLNISLTQLPKIKITDPAHLPGFQNGRWQVVHSWKRKIMRQFLII